jgi:hypothetical protein
MKKYLILCCIALILFIKCVDKKQPKQKFIEENFLKIVDTLAYSRGAFITLPKDTIKYSKLSLKLSKEINYNPRVDEFILEFFKKNKELKKNFEEVILVNEKKETLIDETFPKKIGKYHIYFDKKDIDNSIKYAGLIGFTNLKIKNNKAFLIFSESVEHYGKSYIVLLIKDKNNWKVVKKELLWQS